MRKHLFWFSFLDHRSVTFDWSHGNKIHRLWEELLQRARRDLSDGGRASCTAEGDIGAESDRGVSPSPRQQLCALRVQLLLFLSTLVYGYYFLGFKWFWLAKKLKEFRNTDVRVESVILTTFFGSITNTGCYQIIFVLINVPYDFFITLIFYYCSTTLNPYCHILVLNKISYS